MVQVTYQGGGMDGVTSNAASEATLQLLVKSLGGGSGGAGAGASAEYSKAQKAGTVGQKAANKAQTTTTKSTTALGKAANVAGKGLKMVGNAAKGVMGMAIGAIGNVANTAANLGKELLVGGNRLTDFSKHISGLAQTIPLVGGLLGGAIETMTGMIQGQVDVFRQLSSTGIDFGGSMFETMKIATETNLSLEQFSTAIAQGSQNLSMMFGGATAGARAFAGIQKELKGTIGELNRLGITIDEVGEFTNDYLEIQRISGRYKQMDDRALAAGTKDYIMQLDQLAKVTGMSRKEAAAALREQANDKRLQALFATMSDETRKVVDNSLAMMGNVGPEFKEGITELIATGGAPLSEYSKGLVATMPEIGEAARKLKEGGITNEEFVATVKRAQAKQQEFVKANGAMISTVTAQGNNIYASTLDLVKAGEIAGDLPEAVKQQRDAAKTAGRGLTEFEGKIQNIRNKIVNALIDSGIFDKLTIVFEGVADTFTKLFAPGAPGMVAFDGAMKWISDTITKFTDGMKNMSFGAMIKEYIWEPLKKAIGGMLFGTAGTPDKKDQRGRTTEKGTEGSSGLLSPIVDGLKSVGKYLLIGGVAMGVLFLGLGLAIGKLAIPLGLAAPGFLALGVAMAGIGAAGAGISLLIDSIFNSVGNLADGVKKFEEMDGAKLALVGGGLKEITGPIAALAAGGIVANFVGKDALGSLARGVKAFEDLDPANLHAVGPALTSLHKGMSAFTGDGVLDSIGKALGSLFGGSSGGIADLAEDVKLFADVDAAGLQAIGDGLQGIANFLEAMDGANLKSVSKSLTELTKQLGDYQTQYSKMDADAKANLVSNFTSFGEGQKGAADKLDQLNSSVQMMLVELRKQSRSGQTVADNLV